MGTPLTRQDLLAITDNAKNNVIQKLLTRQELQGVTDNARDRVLNTINTYHVENQNLLRQTTNQTENSIRRVANIEQQVTALRQDLRALTQAVDRLYSAQAQQYNRLRSADPSERY